MSHTLRPLQTIDEYKACEKLQKEAWDFDDSLDVIPLTNLVTVQKWGGLVLGAFDENGVLRGFCYGFLGFDELKRHVHSSHMLAVDAEVRDGGLGARLKWAQRDFVLGQGVRLIVWTYDPLESKNACLNFTKLGGLADTYLVNFYGETTSQLHSGTPTDRLSLIWVVDALRVARRAAGERSPVLEALKSGEIDAPWALEADGFSPGEPQLDLGADRIRCEIPGDIQGVKAHDREAAIAWRKATRAVFKAYFANGYYARECTRTVAEPASGSEPRTVYLLERGSMEKDGVKE